jgi:MFS family permease
VNRNDRAIVGLVMVGHAMVHTFELSIPILVTIWLGAFDTTTGTLGTVVAAGYALFGVGAVPGGVLADAYGSRRLIAACLAGMGGSFLLLAAAPSLLVVALALVLWGAAASVYHPSGLSLVSTGVTQRGRAFAYHGMAGNAGIALGPLATTLLLVAFDWRTVAALLAVPAAAAAAFALLVDVDETAAVKDQGERAVEDSDETSAVEDSDETSAVEERADADTQADGGERADGGRGSAGVRSLGELVAESRALFAGGFVAVFGVVMLSGLYYRGVLTFLPAMLADLPTFDPVAVAGTSLEPSRYLYAGLLGVGILGQYVGGRLTDRIRVERGLAGAFAVLAVVALVYVPAMDAGLGWLLAASVALGFALFVVQPLYQAAVAAYTPADTRGLSYGFTYLGVFGVGALGASVAGFTLQVGSPSLLFVVLAAFATGASAISVALSLRDWR